MIDLVNTRIQLSRFFPVTAGAVITEEGLALVSANNGGSNGANLSQGTTGETFLGVALNYTMLPTRLPYINTYTAPGAAGITLPQAPISGQIYVYDVTGAAALTAGGSSPASGEYYLNGTVLKFNAAQQPHTILVQMAYTPTVDQALAQYGEGFPGAQASQQVQGTIGAITRGTVATSCFDVTAAWTAGSPVQVAANGYFTQGKSGVTTLSNVIVNTAPTGAYTWLVLDLLA